jgi:ATP-dependent exoDNAse (exonuclease V) beta subunit
MTFDRNTVVWASAGTGKTRKLVNVYVELLERGIDPLRIVAVTFTEKAAAEMRERIRAALCLKPGRWRKTITALSAAPIGTIHGFCGALIREKGFDIGIDPSFTVLDEQHSLDLARESARDTIRREICSGNEDAERLFADFGLETLVDTLVSATYWLNSLGVGSCWLDERIQAQRAAAAELHAKLGFEIEKFGGDFEKIGELADELDARRARHPLRTRDDPAALLPQIGRLAGLRDAERLSRLVMLSADRFRARKRAANAMDFDDLLLGARDLLKQHAAIRRHYQNRFQALLIDEFQDTDEVQAEIVTLLAEDPLRPGRLSAGKLMIVGDPKQSIYRFRRARVTVFFRLLDRILAEGGALEHLQDNYRSAAPIVQFSNALCQVMMDGGGKIRELGAGAADPSAGIDLSYRIRFSDRDALRPKSDAPFLGITYVAAEAGAKAAQGRQMEATAIARLLKDWKSSGRIGSWKQVGMLFRAATNIGIYLNALEAHGIPVYVVQGTAFYQKSEVSDLIAFLELVLHPQDELLRATVLTSSLFGMTLEELWQSFSNNGGLKHTHSATLDAILTRWVERRDSATAAEILEDVIRKTDFDAVMMAQKNGLQRVANIGKLVEITRDLARQGTTALDDVVRYLRDRAHDISVREPEAQVVSQLDDVVRVLTVHQAKGLEFDIVIIPDLAARTPRAQADRAFFSDRWGLLVGSAYGLHRKPLPHALILEEKKREEDQQYEEEKRLLYVAVTRARRMLVIGEGFSKQAGPWLQWMGRLLDTIQPGAIEKARQGTPQTVRFRGSSLKVLPASLLNTPEQLELSAGPILVGEFRIPIVEPPPPARAVELTPSELGLLAGCLRYFHWTRILGVAEPGGGAGDSVAMRLGSAAHKILESAIRPPADVLLEAGMADLSGVFESPQWRELAALGPERELPFMMYVSANGNDCWIRGRMDAAVVFDSSGSSVPRVVDYKYALWHEGADAFYEMQMISYALALMKAVNTDRALTELWYLKPPMKIVRREYTRDFAEERVRRLVASYLAAVESGRWPAADRAYCDRVECGFRERCWSSA